MSGAGSPELGQAPVDVAGATAPMGPVAEPQRIAALDALRGVAIFGIFMVNMAFFAGPFVNLLNVAPPSFASASDKAAWAIVKTLFEYKFISTFSLLFGMGLIIHMGRAEKRGVAFVPMYLRRIAVLAAIGFVHAFGLWYGDILLFYAGIALIALLLRNLAPAKLLTLAVAGILAPALLSGALVVLSMVLGGTMPAAAGTEAVEDASPTPAEQAPPEYTAPPGTWARVNQTLQWIMEEPGDIARWGQLETVVYKEGPLTAALVVRAGSYLAIGLGFCTSLFAVRVAGFFLLGAALIKLDFFSPRRRPLQWTFCLVGLSVGLLGEAGIVAVIAGATGEESLTRAMVTDPFHNVFSAVLCLGYVGAVTLVASSRIGFLMAPFAAVGRLALSNYILQTVVSTFIMYWWGLACFGDVSRSAQLLLVLTIFAGQVLLSVVYMQVFTIGPLEWVWRSLTYGRAQPFLRRT